MKKGWEIKKLGEVCEINLGKTPPRGDASMWNKDKQTHNVWLSIADLNNTINNKIFDSKEYISDKAKPLMKIVKKGTLLMSFKLTIGRCAFAGTDLYTNEAIAALPLKNNNLSPLFLKYYLEGFNWKELTKGDLKVKGATLNKEKLKIVPILMPPLSEQKRIVSVLDAAFAKIEAVKEKTARNLQNTKELFQSELQKCMSPQSSTNKKGWKKYKLEEFGMKAGKNVKASDIKEKYFKGSYPCFGGNGFRGYIDRFSNDGTYLIVGRQGALCGNVKMATGKFYATEHAVVLTKINQSIFDITFLYYVLTAFDLNKYSTGAAQPGLSVNVINKLDIFVPPLSEQQQIVLRLDVLSAKVKQLETNYKAVLANCEELKQSILAKVFNGEI